MPFMTTYEPGDAGRVRFPFTDLSSAKKRPALVLSPSGYQKTHGDIVVLALTSRRQDEPHLQLRNWGMAGLPKPTWCKPVVGTLSSTIVVHHLGKLSPEDIPAVRTAISSLIEPTFL